MKRKFLFMSVITSLFMAGCSQDEIDPNGGEAGNGEVNKGYMAVSLVNADEGGPRAAQDGFEDGTPEENNITAVRFYFFNAAGGVVYTRKDAAQGKYVNYFDWTPGETENDSPDDDIEKRYKAVVVFNTEKGDATLPQMIAAVINPTESLKNKGNQSLSDLKGIANNYAGSDFTTSGKFVMFNSVYRDTDSDRNQVEVSALNIPYDCIASSEAAALSNPVKIYVERSVAKVSVEIGLSSDDYIDKGGYKLLKLKDTNDQYITVENGEKPEQVYLKLDKWGLTAETDKGRLVKKINPQWPRDMSWVQDPSMPYRSCWAINTLEANNVYYDHTHEKTEIGSGNYVYTNENAQFNDISGTMGKAQSRTKVKINGLLCKEDGTPLTLYRHLGSYFVDTYSATESENMLKLKESILNQLNGAESGRKFYTAQVAGKEVTFTQISKNDIEIQVVEQTESESSSNKGVNCYVVAQLTSAAKAKKWYSTDDKETYEKNEVQASEIDKLLYDKDADTKAVDPALVWREGMTYYYYEIIHNKNANQSGVVRNHIYKTKITGIKGLGTPVYDPEKKIYPEKPNPNDRFIAAEVNILSWHIVSDEYELKW